MDTQWLDDALLSLTHGLYLVTSRSGDRGNGLLASAVLQCSDDPPGLAVSINHHALTYEYIQDSGLIGVSVLEQQTPLEFLGLFGFRSGRQVDKLAQVAHLEGATGCPLVTEHALALLETKVFRQVVMEKHTVFFTEVLMGQIVRSGTALTYAYYRDVKHGYTPPEAPTPSTVASAAPRPKRREPTMGRYVCDVCGYVYDPVQGDPDNGVAAGTAFADVPEDWVCPVCGVGKDEFSPE